MVYGAPAVGVSVMKNPRAPQQGHPTKDLHRAPRHQVATDNAGSHLGAGQGKDVNRVRPTGRPRGVKNREPMTDRIRRLTEVDPTSGCHNWRAKTTPAGYGTMTLPGQKKRLAHRVAWEVANGPIPDDLTIDHICQNTSCVNVEHLQLMSRADNTRGAEPTRRRWHWSSARGVTRT